MSDKNGESIEEKTCDLFLDGIRLLILIRIKRLLNFSRIHATSFFKNTNVAKHV